MSQGSQTKIRHSMADWKPGEKQCSKSIVLLYLHRFQIQCAKFQKVPVFMPTPRRVIENSKGERVAKALNLKQNLNFQMGGGGTPPQKKTSRKHGTGTLSFTEAQRGFSYGENPLKSESRCKSRWVRELPSGYFGFHACTHFAQQNSTYAKLCGGERCGYGCT